MSTKCRHGYADPLMELLCVLSDVPIRFSDIRRDLRAHGYANNEAIRGGLTQIKTKYNLRLIYGESGHTTTVRVHPACMARVREMGQGYWTGSRRQAVNA